MADNRALEFFDMMVLTSASGREFDRIQWLASEAVWKSWAGKDYQQESQPLFEWRQGRKSVVRYLLTNASKSPR
jgi:hypothetical protein